MICRCPFAASMLPAVVLLPEADCRRKAGRARAGFPAELMPRGGTAVDIGANQGFYAYALAAIADRVVAFEPTPTPASSRAGCCAARRGLRAGTRRVSRGTLHVPVSDQAWSPPRQEPEGTHAQFRRARLMMSRSAR
jgi:hypothetical protein